jgi:hypothetical protein
MNSKLAELTLEEIAMLCRRGEQTAWRHFGVKRGRFEEFFREINQRMLHGEEKISQIELDSLALGSSQPKATQPRLAGPTETPKEISIADCLRIVDGMEKQPHSKESITDESCKMMRTALNVHAKDGATPITWDRWDTIAKSAIDIAHLTRTVEINRKRIKLNEIRIQQEKTIAELCKKKIADWNRKHPENQVPVKQ